LIVHGAGGAGAQAGRRGDRLLAAGEPEVDERDVETLTARCRDDPGAPGRPEALFFGHDVGEVA